MVNSSIMLCGIQPTISTLAEGSYLDATTADVNFIFKIGRRKKNKRIVRVPAHKILLKFRSDVFNAMFYGRLMEKGDVQIVDATADVFKEFLKIFYFDEPTIEMVHVPDVLQLIRKYNVTGGSDYYDEFLESSIAMDNVCWIYDLALEFQLDSTKIRCEEQISLKAAEIFQSNDFLETSYETVLQIVSLNNFACDEYIIFQSWAKEKCLREGLNDTNLLNLRNQMQDILYRIRFRSMSSTHLGDIIREYHSFLTKDELADIALLEIVTDSDPKTLIRKEYRNNAWDKGHVQLCTFIDSTESQMKTLDRFESVTFSSDKQIILRRIRLGNLYVNEIKVDKYEPANLKLQIIKKSKDNEEIVYNTEYPKDSLTFGDWFALPKMIFIQPLIQYEIRLEYWDITDNKYCAHGRRDSSVVRTVTRHFFDIITITSTITISGNATSIRAMKFCKM